MYCTVLLAMGIVVSLTFKVSLVYILCLIIPLLTCFFLGVILTCERNAHIRDLVPELYVFKAPWWADETVWLAIQREEGAST